MTRGAERFVRYQASSLFSDSLSDAQQRVLRVIADHDRADKWYRSPHRRERVTLECLYRMGWVMRRFWKFGGRRPYNPHEYRLAPDTLRWPPP